MRHGGAARVASLIVTAGSKAYAIPGVHVVETMRPLPIEVIAGAPPFVLGLSVIRGAPVPVVDLDALVGVRRTVTVSRFVSLRLVERRVALAADGVIGMRELEVASVAEMPPLLREARAGIIEEVGVLDAQLLLVLQVSRFLPEEVWQRLSDHESPS